MIYFLMFIFLLSSFIAPVCGSEKKTYLVKVGDETGVVISLSSLCHNQIHFYVPVYIAYNHLCYSDKKYIDFLKTNYGVECDYNEPCIRMNHDLSKKEYELTRQALKEKFIHPITLIPLRYFIVGDTIKKDGNILKSQGDTLLSFAVVSVEYEQKPIHIKLGTDFVTSSSFNKDDSNSNYFEEMLKRFRKTTLHVYELGEKKATPTTQQEYDNLKQELVAAQILTPDEEHGPKSYFGEEIRAEQFYSRLKQFLCCSGLVAAIVLYALYKKFYTAAN